MVKNRISTQTLAWGAFLSIIFFQSCALHPTSWSPAQRPVLENALAINDKLETSEKIDLNGWYGPEDIVFDQQGNLYCGVHIGAKDFSDGKILKISPTGDVEVFYGAGSWVAGLHFDADGNLIALRAKRKARQRYLWIICLVFRMEFPCERMVVFGWDSQLDGMTF